MAVVKLEHVGKRYDDGAQIISDVSLTLEAGAFCFLTGASGSGKTTLLRLITLAERPTHGTLTLFGTDTAALDRKAQAAVRRRIGIVFQDLWLIDALSAGDNVALPLRIAGAPEHAVRDNVAELFAWVGLAGRADALAATLSGGERQRVAIARAMVMQPAAILADEPTGNLDQATGREVIHLLEELNARGVALILVTHDPALAERARRRIHMLDGRIDSDSAAA